jgi:thioredoxin-related protein
MKFRKTLLSALGFIGLAMAPVSAETATWMTDFEAAKSKATEENKSILINFMGSDWCGLCVKLNKEIFTTEKFFQEMKDKFVFVALDYPRRPETISKMSEETIAQNEKLHEEYMIPGFPTVLLTDDSGRPFARTGYLEIGPEAYMANLNRLLEVREDRDDLFKVADEHQGVEKAKANLNALQKLEVSGSLLTKFYSDQIEQIEESGLEDGEAFIKEIKDAEKFAQFQSELQKLGSTGQHEAALELVQETLEKAGFADEPKQQVAVIKVIILAELGKLDESLTALDDAKAIAPESEVAGRLDELKSQIMALKKQN